MNPEMLQNMAGGEQEAPKPNAEAGEMQKGIEGFVEGMIVGTFKQIAGIFF